MPSKHRYPPTGLHSYKTEEYNLNSNHFQIISSLLNHARLAPVFHTLLLLLLLLSRLKK